MKKLLLILLALGFALPASADVFIYSHKSSGSGTDNNNGDWGTFKVTETAYTIIQVNFNDTNKIDIWAIGLTKANGIKYAALDEIGEVNFVVAPLSAANKTVWIIGADDSNGFFMVSGQAKQKKIDIGYSPLVASSLSGPYIWDQTIGSHRAIGIGKIAMSLNTDFTKQAHNYSTAKDAANALIAALRDYYGYTILP
jgi:hypothetical protein